MTRDEHENSKFCSYTIILAELEESKNGHNDSLEPPKDFFTQPKQSKQIDNPWIDKAVHEEVLERKKVSFIEKLIFECRVFQQELRRWLRTKR